VKQISLRRLDIQILRGLAVIGVVLFHANENFFRNGLLGVDIFFVISGFVVAPLIIEVCNSESPKIFVQNFYKFLRNRFFRLAPALFVMLIFTGLIIIIFSSISDLGRISRQGIYTLFLSGNIGAYKFAGNYFAPTPNPLIHTWSLAVEEQFYLVIPLIIGLISLLIIQFKKYINSFLLPSITSFSFILFWKPDLLRNFYAKFGISQPEWASFYFPTSRAWEFLLGYLTFLVTKKYISAHKVGGRFRLPRIIVLLIFLLAPFKINSRNLVVCVVLLTCVTIYKQDFEFNHKFIRRGLILIGDRSYSIYLLHMPLLYVPLTSPLYAQSGVPKSLGIFLSLILTFVFAHFVYSRIEIKFRIRRGNIEESKQTIRINLRRLLIIGIIPIAIFSILIQGESKKYWGLDRNLDVPKYAGFLDVSCQRDTFNGPPCDYSNFSHAKTVLLIGDSHAGQFSQAMVDAAEAAHWNSVIWTHSACRFELYSGVPEWCRNVNSKILKYIRINAPALVVLSQSNSLNPNLSSSVKSIALLATTANKLVIVEETPRFTDAEFMNSGTLFQKPYNPPKYREMRIALERYVINANKIYSSKPLSKAKIINVNHNFCTETRCYRWKNGEWLYRDSNHLSVAGAKLTEPDFTRLLKSYY
jgi:peptidoglycan/LPS O-acetylase OafA/YrhL